MKIILPLFLTASLGASSAYGWGADGHETVGFVAMSASFLAPKALSFVRSSLGCTYDESLGPAATWADEVRPEPAYAWSANLHFVDALDNAPTSCSVSQSRDCPDNQCILGAIANYTTRVADTHLSAVQRQEALKFLDHFIGDIAQPLHVENIAAGGNGIDAKCNGSSTNLHSVWDSGMINRLLPSKYNNSVTTWAAALVTRIKSGSYKCEASNWIACSSTTETVSKNHDSHVKHDIIPLECPLVWAKDSNMFGCSVVFNFTSGQDLCTSSYYDEAIPVIEKQIAKAGYRLAAWLNSIFDGATHLP
ncbi:hypothetical protein AGABI2DRAFT_214751 [Agaricus bisporus var. bisporus H97]|uniref:hypothetical protein n=1 Tax=Agaricus bisporus var. bisporus (strain H97 / ATCC MYA-4626 / FGSC 10389) TaxID=936046 RepID=UPI00029F7E65|nr:hypothetical protein AGABI2DRAFT_214751 [Agaricus bisporus var. bisporus H97]EKV51569.1 hypothetical protein AGABI2DRAFT_214751 [Agaricus bisporus var. bisporus H97]